MRKLTRAAVGGQVAVAVAIACCAAVDTAVILVGAVVGPCVREPRLTDWLTDVQQTRPAETHSEQQWDQFLTFKARWRDWDSAITHRSHYSTVMSLVQWNI